MPCGCVSAVDAACGNRVCKLYAVSRLVGCTCTPIHHLPTCVCNSHGDSCASRTEDAKRSQKPHNLVTQPSNTVPCRISQSCSESRIPWISLLLIAFALKPLSPFTPCIPNSSRTVRVERRPENGSLLENLVNRITLTENDENKTERRRFYCETLKAVSFGWRLWTQKDKTISNRNFRLFL